MTPGRASDAGAWLPARPGTRGAAARGSVSGGCPEASRRRAGIQVAMVGHSSAVLTRMVPSTVSSSLTLAGRSFGCPALFRERDHVSAAAVFLPRCAGRRRLLAPSPDGSRRQQFKFRASAYSPWVHVGRQGHHARAGLGRAHRPVFIGPPEAREADTLHHALRDVPDALPSVAHRPRLQNPALRMPRQELPRCAFRSP